MMICKHLDTYFSLCLKPPLFLDLHITLGEVKNNFQMPFSNPGKKTTAIVNVKIMSDGS